MSTENIQEVNISSDVINKTDSNNEIGKTELHQVTIGFNSEHDKHEHNFDSNEQLVTVDVTLLILLSNTKYDPILTVELLNYNSTTSSSFSRTDQLIQHLLAETMILH